MTFALGCQSFAIFFILTISLTTFGAEPEPAQKIDTGKVEAELSKMRLDATEETKITPSSFELDWQVTLREDCKHFSNSGKNVQVCNYSPTLQPAKIIQLQLLKITTVSEITVSSADWEIDTSALCIRREQISKIFHSNILPARNPSADSALGGLQPDHEFASYEISVRNDQRGEIYFTVNEFDKCAAQVRLYKTESP